MKTIYKTQCPQLQAIFEQVKSPQNVICVALDYAKSKHVALVCDGNGNILKQPFTVVNSLDGVTFLTEQIDATARRRKIPRKHIFIGGEDFPSYVENFLHCLKKLNFLILGVNALKAKQNRENEIASNDQLALLGIAKTLLSRRAQVYGDPRENKEDSIYLDIRNLSRSRHAQVKQSTVLSNQIHTHVDRLFPGFLDGSKSGITPFGPASLELMKDQFSCTQIARKKSAGFAQTLRRWRVQNAEETASKLIGLAKQSLPPNPLRVNSQQNSLQTLVELLECSETTARNLKIENAVLLASTPYAFLTTIPGIGFTIACGTAGELGEPRKLGKIDSLCGYSGIVAGSVQTGGPDSAPVMTKTKRRCNRQLKNWVSQASDKMSKYAHLDWRNRYTRWQENGQHALFAGGRRYLRLVKMLTVNQTAYQSLAARQSDATKEIRAQDAEETWKILLQKWQTIPNYQEVAFGEDKPLGMWRRLMIELYESDMPLPRQR